MFDQLYCRRKYMQQLNEMDESEYVVNDSDKLRKYSKEQVDLQTVDVYQKL